jgi:hypothetical protein
MSHVLLPPDPNRPHLILDVARDALPVRLVSDPPAEAKSPSERLIYALQHIWGDAPTRQILIIPFTLVFGIALAFTSFLSLTAITPEAFTPSGLGYTIEYPIQLVAREDEQISVTLVNRSPISFTHVSATLVFSDALPVSSNTTVAHFENLAPGERKTQLIHFTVNQPLDEPIDNSIEVNLQVSANQFGIDSLGTYSMDIPRLPWLKTLGTRLWGVLSTGLGGVSLWILHGAFKGAFPE